MEDICPICEDKESQSAHGCDDCGEYVCQNCYNFETGTCLNCDEK